jgi:hypothetical protein
MNDERGPFFVRQSRVGNWDAISRDSNVDLEFPVDVLVDVIDQECQTSLWEVERLDAPEIDYLAAALTSPSASRFRDVTFRFISKYKLATLGLKKYSTKGTSLDKELNKKHWIVEISKITEAITFVKELKVRDPKIYSKDDVARIFSFSLDSGRLNTNNISKELLLQCINGKHLKHVISGS